MEHSQQSFWRASFTKQMLLQAMIRAAVLFLSVLICLGVAPSARIALDDTSSELQARRPCHKRYG